MKMAMESSVRSKDSHVREMQPAPGRCFRTTGCARDGHAAAMSRLGRRSALPGVQPSTYSTAGSSWEHGNPDPSAGPARFRQAARSGDVSDGGRSLRSSPSAGEPRTWRRETVDASASTTAGESHVCGVPSSGWAPDREVGAVHANGTGSPNPLAQSSRESPVHNERCTPGSEGGARKPTGESRQGAGRPPYVRHEAQEEPMT